MEKTSLPPGFRFHPTDVELVKYYLKRKVMGKRLGFNIISEVDIYKFAPWDLPDQSCLKSRDLKWYFFSPRERKYSTGSRTKRVAKFGFWKATGNDRTVLYNKETVGMIKTLIFHRGKAPQGERTNWVMHEYRLEDKDLANRGIVQDAYVLCLIFQKEGPGPRNGAQYGAPFKEEDWSDDDAEVDCVQVTPFGSLPEAATVLRINQNTSAATNSCMGSIYEAGPSETFLPNEKKHKRVPSNDVMSMLAAFHVPEDDDAISMLPAFTEDNTSVPVVNDKNEEQNLQQPNNPNHGKNVEAAACMDRNDIFNKLEDLGGYTELSENRYDVYGGYKVASVLEQILSGEDVPYLELTDLNSPLNGPTEPIRFGHEPTDSLFANHSGYNSEQFYQMNSFGSAPRVSEFGQSSMLLRGPCDLESQYNSFQKEDGLNQNASQGYMGFDTGL